MTEYLLRQRVVAQARSWLGRKEADGSHREIIDLYNTITPLPRGYKMTYADPWCAAFVSAVGAACGLTAYIFPECGCGPMIALYQAAGRWMEDDAYTPQPGDVIFYDWQDTGLGDNTGSSDHVGLVAAVDGSRITIIEGNCADSVCYQTRQVDGRYIRGYGLPDYAAAAAALGEDDVGTDAPDGPSDEHPAVVVVPEPVGADAYPQGTQPGGPDPEPSPSTCRPELPVLQRGMTGEAVRAAQLLLIGHGHRCGPAGADGEFGPATVGAVYSFQQSRRLAVDGIIGPETWAALITM